MGLHTVEITNTGAPDAQHSQWVWFDLDWVAFETSIESAQTQSITYGAADPALTYQPNVDGVWSQSLGGKGSYSNTIKTTSTDKATVQFKFRGDAVALYGPIGSQTNNHFNVMLNGIGRASVFTDSSTDATGVTLFLATNLGHGIHTLQVININTQYDAPSSLTIDSIEVWGGSAVTEKPSTPVGAIAGGIVGGVVLLAVLGILLIRFLRRRRRQSLSPTQGSDDMIETMDDSTRTEPYNVGAPYYAQHLSVPSHPSEPLASISEPYSPAFPSSSGSRSSAIRERTETVSNSFDSRGPLNVQNASEDDSGEPMRVPSLIMARRHEDRRRAGKLQPSPVPSQSSEGWRSAGPNERLRRERLVVEGRPQDFGPVQSDEANDILHDLPPDYRQAIQPLPSNVSR